MSAYSHWLCGQGISIVIDYGDMVPTYSCYLYGHNNDYMDNEIKGWRFVIDVKGIIRRKKYLRVFTSNSNNIKKLKLEVLKAKISVLSRRWLCNWIYLQKQKSLQNCFCTVIMGPRKNVLSKTKIMVKNLVTLSL